MRNVLCCLEFGSILVCFPWYSMGIETHFGKLIVIIEQVTCNKRDEERKKVWIISAEFALRKMLKCKKSHKQIYDF